MSQKHLIAPAPPARAQALNRMGAAKGVALALLSESYKVRSRMHA